MSQLLFHGGELLSISHRNKSELEVSSNKGRTWTTRYKGGTYGEFLDLIWAEDELLGLTTKGLYYSKDMGRTWLKRS